MNLNLNAKFLVLLLGITSIILVAGIVYYFSIPKKLTVPKTNRGYPLHQSVEQTLIKSDKYHYLINQTDQAILEKDTSQKYQLLINLFRKLNEVYQENTDPKTLAILYQLKSYSSVLKPYKIDDFVLKVKK